MAHPVARLPSGAASVCLRAARVLRALWLGVGLVLALLLALELTYRAQASLRRALGAWRAPALPASPAASESWYPPLMAETHSTSISWRPYVYYRRQPFHGRYLTIDSLGHRATLQAHTAPGKPREVFVFGASPVWGTGLRDSMTIPSRLAVELARRGIPDVAVTNFGEAGYVFTQDIIELLLQLRAGARPAAVLFYGGYNDIQSAMENGRAGATKVERDAARDFSVVRPLFTWRTDLATEAGLALRLFGVASSRLQILDRLRPAPRSVPNIPVDSLADDIADTYLRTVEVVEALAQHYGFVAFYMWMPILDETKTQQSPFERAIAAGINSWPVQREFTHLHRLVTHRVEPVMRDVVPGRFGRLSQLFASDSETVYLDDQGHTTEAASARIAAAVARYLGPVLSGRDLRARPSSPGRRDR